MDVVTILQNVPTAIGIVIAAYSIGRFALAIVKVIADAVAARMNAKTRIIELEASVKTDEANARTRTTELEAQAKTRVAEIEANAKIKAAELALELARANAGLAAENDTYRTQADAMRLAQATALQETVRALGRLVSGQKSTDSLVKGSESRLGAIVEGARDATSQSLEEFKDLFIMTIDMMMEDPRASYERIKRMQKAWAEGDMEKAQAVVDEEVSPLAAEAAEEIIQP